MLDIILVSNYSMKEELSEALAERDCLLHDYLIQDIQHIERYPIDDEYKTIIIQSANAIKKIDSSNNHIYNTERLYGIGPNCRKWVEKKFGVKCFIPEKDFSSLGLVNKINSDGYELGKTLLLKGVGGKNIINKYLLSNDIDFKICDVYKRVLNEDNLREVARRTNNGAIIIGFSKSSVEPLIADSSVDLKKLHFFVLNKSEEDIIDKKMVGSLTKIDDIYEVNELAEKIKKINE
tara:strand:- start:2930 stop:3634 length:705 start_codon:yes stop_codon:yes gene_type:complete